MTSQRHPSLRRYDHDARISGWLAAALLLLGLLFGGGTRSDVFSDLVVQFCAVWVLAYGVMKLDWYYLPTERRQMLLLALGVALVILLQLVPISASLWAWFPGRDEISHWRKELGLSEPAFRPWTTAPDASWASLRALLPALALLVIGVQMHEFWRRRLLAVILIVALISVPLGLAQIVQGPDSELRLYTPTNNQQAVGFFANRNHYAALLYVGLALALGFFLTFDRNFRDRLNGKGLSQAIWWTLLGAFLMVGLMLSRSRAGVGLAILVTLFMISVGFMRRKKHRLSNYWLVGLALSGALFASFFGYSAFSTRLEGDWLDHSRWQVTSTSLALARDYGYLGTGAGSFPAAYAAFEPIDLLGDKIINHAHNDWAELLVEFGVPFIALAGLFIAWLIARAPALIAAARHDGLIPLIPASIAAFVALLIHSLVDYPLRTTALSLVFVALLLQLLPSLPHDPASRGRHKRTKNDEASVAAEDGRLPLRKRLRVVEGGRRDRQSSENAAADGWI